MRAEGVHATLAFLGELSPTALPQLETLAAALPRTTFELVLERACYWAHNRIVWAGTSNTPAPLAARAEALRAGLAAAALPCDPQPFVAHVTLIRDARGLPSTPRFESITWPVRGFVLVHSQAGRYRVIGRWES